MINIDRYNLPIQKLWTPSNTLECKGVLRSQSWKIAYSGRTSPKAHLLLPEGRPVAKAFQDFFLSYSVGWWFQLPDRVVVKVRCTVRVQLSARVLSSWALGEQQPSLLLLSWAAILRLLLLLLPPSPEWLLPPGNAFTQLKDLFLELVKCSWAFVLTVPFACKTFPISLSSKFTSFFSHGHGGSLTSQNRVPCPAVIPHPCLPKSIPQYNHLCLF